MYNFINLMCSDENVSRADWIVNSFPVIKIVIMCLLALCSIAMIVMVVMQKSNTTGSGALTGQTDTFYNRNKGATLQGAIKVLTIIVASVMLVLCISYLVLNQIYQGTI